MSEGERSRPQIKAQFQQPNPFRVRANRQTYFPIDKTDQKAILVRMSSLAQPRRTSAAFLFGPQERKDQFIPAIFAALRSLWKDVKVET